MQLKKLLCGINITDEQLKMPDKIQNCKYCSCSFIGKNNKVMHHNHITGDYINTICNKCNLQLKCKIFIPVCIYNCKGWSVFY